MKVLLVVNPVAGAIDKEDFVNEAHLLCQKYGISIDVFYTTGQDDVRALAHQVKTYAPNKVVAVGGDGTVLMTGLALLKTAIPMGIIPLGSSNGMAKELEVASDLLMVFHDLLLTEMLIPIDLIKVNNTFYSMHLGDVGINARIIEKYTQGTQRGWTAYAKHFLTAITEAETFNVKINIEGALKEHQAYTVIIANTRMYGTGMIVNPEGNPHDGLLEIVVIYKRNLEGLIHLGLSSISEDMVNRIADYAIIYQVKKANIFFEEAKLLQLDGELVGKHQTISVEVLPSAIHFLSTAGHPFFKTE